MARWALAAGLFLSSLACTRDAGDQGAPTPNPAPSTPGLAAAPPLAAPSLEPSQPGRDGLAVFEQTLARTLDPSRKSTRPVSSGDGVLHIPNGYAAHASILVRQPDGTLRSACVSSTAEVSALVNEIRNGAGQ
jgi:hypothetical protein